MEQRRVGRPLKGSAEVGRQGLITRARDALRERRFDLFQRKEFAIACCVTPALITYHFPRPNEIFEAVIEPVVNEIYSKVCDITASTLEPSEKYSLVVRLLIDAFNENGNIIDVFEYAVSMKMCNSMDYIALMKGELQSLSDDCFNMVMTNPLDRSTFHGAVWGMCQAAAKYCDGGENSRFDTPIERITKESNATG